MKILVFLLLTFPFIGYAQPDPDTCFTQEELIDISETMDSLWTADSLNNSIISKQHDLIREKRIQPKWYDNKVIWFGSGIVSTILTAKLIVDVVK